MWPVGVCRRGLRRGDVDVFGCGDYALVRMRGLRLGSWGLRVVLRGAVAVVLGLALFPACAGAVIPLPIHPTRTDDPVAPAGTSCSSSSVLDTDCSLRNALADATVDGESVSLGSPSPPGPYMVQQGSALSISHNINLVGVGARSSVIERTAGFVASVLFVSSAVTGGATVRDVTITGGSTSEGAGIFSDGVLTVQDSTITGNDATSSGGGGIFSDGPTLTVIGSTISGNTAHGGAGIFAGGANTLLVNSTVSGNTTVAGTSGGGIFVNGGALSLANVTLSTNHAPGGGMGGNIYNKGTMSSKNTIIAGGTATSSTENCGGPGTINSTGFNIEDRNQCGFASTGDQVNTDPLLGPLQNNGGQTDTQAPPLDSPPIDHGNPAGCTDPSNTSLTVDQRGLARPQGLACDVGAYELQPVAPAATAAPTTGIGTAAATLNGMINSHGFQTSWHFDYGPTIAYGSSTPIQTLVSGTEPVSVTIAGLLPSTTYHFTLIASTSGGTTETVDQTFTTAPGPGGSPSSTGGAPPGPGVSGAQPPAPTAVQAPMLGPIAIAPSAFRAAASGASIARTRRTGATVTYTDTQPSTTAFTVLQARPGVILRGRCGPPPKHPPRRGRACTRYVTVGGFTHTDTSGRNRFRFTGRVNGHKLPPGNYRLAATPRSHNTAGKTVRAHFRILR